VIDEEEEKKIQDALKKKKLDDERKSKVPIFIDFKIIKTGASFGELALITNKPRAATINCMQDCHFAVMAKSDYEKVL
jgi:CRP-like cAMP-binding protein